MYALFENLPVLCNTYQDSRRHVLDPLKLVNVAPVIFGHVFETIILSDYELVLDSRHLKLLLSQFSKVSPDTSPGERKWVICG